MNPLLFIIVILVSLIVVRVGAVAFNLTGVEWEQAKFQALSCFSGTGFTTREAEIIVGHPQRRRIAGILMVLGNAGLVTLIATFANSIRSDSLAEAFQVPGLHVVVPSWLLPYANLLLIVIAVLLAFRLFTNNRFSKRLTSTMRHYFIKRDILQADAVQELLVAAGGYGISSFGLKPDDALHGLELRESGLRDRDITVLAIDRRGQALANPPAQTILEPGDRLICFGKLESIRNMVEPPPVESEPWASIKPHTPRRRHRPKPGSRDEP